MFLRERPKIWVLGAVDPEMLQIAALLLVEKQHVQFLTNPAGEHVTPAEAYHVEDPLAGMFPAQPRVYVECCPKTRRPGLIIDHHRSGDPGFGKPPEQFWEASSLGQVARLLGYSSPEIPGFDPDELRVVAAADHCLAAAYAGRCPGVDPENVKVFRENSRAEFLELSLEEYRDLISKAEQALLEAPELVPGIKNLGEQHVREAPEAACRLGIAFLAQITEKGSGRKKVVLQGAVRPEHVNAFKAGELIPGLKDAYGDPQRGFAGGYLE